MIYKIQSKYRFFLFHVFGIEVEMLLQVSTSLFEVSVMRLHTGSISYSDAEVVVFVYDLQTFKFCRFICRFRDFFRVIFLFRMNIWDLFSLKIKPNSWNPFLVPAMD